MLATLCLIVYDGEPVLWKHWKGQKSSTNLFLLNLIGWCQIIIWKNFSLNYEPTFFISIKYGLFYVGLK